MIFKKFKYSFGIQVKTFVWLKLVTAAKRSEKMQYAVQKESHKAV